MTMSPEERDALESKADRAMRRGELSTALEMFGRLVAEFPEDPDLLRKLSQLKDNLQPMELMNAKSRFVPEAPLKAGSSLDQAEALAAKGDYAGAIAGYRKALAEKPDSDLIKERLAELFRLVRPQAPAAVRQATPEQALNEWLSRITARKKS